MNQTIEQRKQYKRNWILEKLKDPIFVAKKNGKVNLWRAKNRTWVNQQAKNYKLKNPEHYKELERKRYALNPQKYLLKNKLRYWANPEKWREYFKKMRKANADYYRLYSRARRAKIRNTWKAIPQQILLDKWFEYKGICAYCPAIADTFDHINPIAKGGSHIIENLVPCCRSCNSKKGTKTLEELKWKINANN